MFAATFQNTVALPLVLITTVCSQIKVPSKDPVTGVVIVTGNGTVKMLTMDECVVKGQLYIFLYIFLHSFLFWIVAYDMMPAQVMGVENEDKDQIDPESTMVQMRNGVTASPLPLPHRQVSVDSISGSVVQSDDGGASLHDSQLADANGATLPRAEDLAGRMEFGSIVESPSPVAMKRRMAENMAVAASLATAVSPTAGAGSSLATAGSSTAPPPPTTAAPPLRRKLATDFVAGSFYGATARMERKRNPNLPENIMQASQVKPTSTNLKTIGKRMLQVVVHIVVLCGRPPILSQLLGTLVGLVRPLQIAFFAQESVLRPVTLSISIFSDAATAVTNLSMSCGLGLKLTQIEKKHLFGGDPEGISRRATFGFVFTKMIFVPGILFGITYGLQINGVLPQDRLLLFVLYMQAMTPSANMVVVIAQVLGNVPASGALSLLVLAQYLVALPSMLMWMSLAFHLTSEVGG